MKKFPGNYGWTNQKSSTLRERISRLILAIQKNDPNTDAIAFRGSSGCAAGFAAALSLDKPMLYVRKTTEESHGYSLECNMECTINKYVIVDDFIHSGETVREIIKKIDDVAFDESIRKPFKYPVCTRIYLYDEDGQPDPVKMYPQWRDGAKQTKRTWEGPPSFYIPCITLKTFPKLPKRLK